MIHLEITPTHVWMIFCTICVFFFAIYKIITKKDKSVSKYKGFNLIYNHKEGTTTIKNKKGKTFKVLKRHDEDHTHAKKYIDSLFKLK